jgi:Ser/Thr protein kinase RdoA (MazF antagonist)
MAGHKKLPGEVFDIASAMARRAAAMDGGPQKIACDRAETMAQTIAVKSPRFIDNGTPMAAHTHPKSTPPQHTSTADAEHRVHGLAADSAAPDWPALTQMEVERVLDGYPQLAAPHVVLWHSPRPLSAAAVVDSGGRKVFVKRHHRRVRTAATLSEEHRFIAHLRAHAAPVPDIFADAQGQTAIALGDWTYEVHACAAGTDLYRDAISWSPLTDLAHAHTAGRALATLHRAAAGFDAGQRNTHILVARDELVVATDLAATLEAQLAQRPGLADYLQHRDWRGDIARVLAPLQRIAQPRLALQPRLWTHNDWHVSNLCWSGAGADAQVTAMLDFGLASPTFALFDLATAIERNAIAWLALDTGDAAVHLDTARALLAGYRTQHPLTASDVHLLADLLPVVHIDFALSEVEYFHAVTGSTAHADVAYDTFLLGHAAWFSTPPAQRLLQALRDSA